MERSVIVNFTLVTLKELRRELEKLSWKVRRLDGRILQQERCGDIFDLWGKLEV